MTDTAGRIAETVRTHLARLSAEQGGPQVSDHLNLFESGLLDSYAFIEMLAELEELLGLEVDFSDIDPAEFATAAGLTRCLSHCAEGADARTH